MKDRGFSVIYFFFFDKCFSVIYLVGDGNGKGLIVERQTKFALQEILGFRDLNVSEVTVKRIGKTCIYSL